MQKNVIANSPNLLQKRRKCFLSVFLSHAIVRRKVKVKDAKMPKSFVGGNSAAYSQSDLLHIHLNFCFAKY